MRDDFHLESTYEYNEEEEWDDDDANWNGEEEATGQEGGSDSKEEGDAYLEFLNDEVKCNGSSRQVPSADNFIGSEI